MLSLVGLIVAADSFRLAAAAYFHLSVVDTHAISCLDSHGPIPQSHLARLMGLTSAAITGVVDRLEQTGTVRRVTDPTDRRRNRLELTEHARDILSESRIGLARAFDPLDPATIDVLTQALPALAAEITHESDRLGS